jgi:hypothetical protein
VRTLSRSPQIAIVLAAVAAIALPASASAGDPDVSLTVAKHKHGPYKRVQETHIALNQAKDFYWKARNVRDARIPDVLLEDSNVYPPGWIARWFRGEHNITPEVRGDGYEFALKAGKSKLFRSRLKRTKTADQLCADASVTPPESDPDFALVAVNDAICLF